MSVEAFVEKLDVALAQQAGPAVLKRGQTYARSGAVQVGPTQSPLTSGIEAMVHGTQIYVTTLCWEGGESAMQLAGKCNCMAGDTGWFCKHQVALALIWRSMLKGESLKVDAVAQKRLSSASKRAQTIQGNEQALQAFLSEQPASQLVKRLLGLAKADSQIAKSLQQWRKLEQAKAQPKDLKPLVQELLSPGRGFLSWRQAQNFCDRARGVLEVLEQTRCDDAQLGADLALHALKRIWVAMEKVDDSSGSLGDLCAQIGEQYAQAMVACGAQPAKFGQEYLSIRLADPYGSFDSDAVEAAMGELAVAKA